MFTGIIREIGTVLAIERKRSVDRLTIHAPKTAVGLQPAESVAVNGVCLTVVAARKGALSFEVVPETSRLTNLGKLVPGAHVNVEPSLSLRDRLNGHIVLGHIDGLGQIVSREEQEGQLELEIRIDRTIRRYLVPKAAVAVDGVSLTVGQRLEPNLFCVFLVPETLKRTTLGSRNVRDLVNIEVDYLAKLVEQLAEPLTGVK
ncbi:MAG: riboflavin synthase [Candidatus Omnitrophica bacterium]|nr:riboflavin synthase [Candidatus Omnitrophota bacterium]